MDEIWTSFPEIGLTHALYSTKTEKVVPISLIIVLGTQKIMMGEFSRNQSRLDCLVYTPEIAFRNCDSHNHNFIIP